MPLVMVVIIMAIVWINAQDSMKQSKRELADMEKARRKTNARMESERVAFYIGCDCSFDEAFQNAYRDMTALGYVPCIPREAYGENGSKVLPREGRCDFRAEKYDSEWVQKRREHAYREWRESHAASEPPTCDQIDAMVYTNYPQTEYEYRNDVKRLAFRSQAYPVGSHIIYPGLGTCEILKHNWIGNGTQGGYYTLKVLTTGKNVYWVKIGDKNIRRQG